MHGKGLRSEIQTDNKSVLGQILEETFLFIRVHIEIQSVCGNGE